MGEAAKTTEHVKFNLQLSRLRVTAEHVIDLLKDIQESLKMLNAPVASEKDRTMVVACLISFSALHTVYLTCEDVKPLICSPSAKTST